MSEIKLLPCPFCGGEGHLYMDEFSKYLTGCEECGFYYGIEIEHDCELEHGWVAKHNTKEEAIKKWNTRKPMERILEKLEEQYGVKQYEGDTLVAYEQAYIHIDEAIQIVNEEGGIE